MFTFPFFFILFLTLFTLVPLHWGGLVAQLWWAKVGVRILKQFSSPCPIKLWRNWRIRPPLPNLSLQKKFEEDLQAKQKQMDNLRVAFNKLIIMSKQSYFQRLLRYESWAWPRVRFEIQGTEWRLLVYIYSEGFLEYMASFLALMTLTWLARAKTLLHLLLGT